MDKRLHRVTPNLEQVLPTHELQEAYETASAAIEAGRSIRALRREAGFTQRDLAAQLGISQARISTIEAGKGRDGPSYTLLRRIVLLSGATQIGLFGSTWAKLSEPPRRRSRSKASS